MRFFNDIEKKKVTPAILILNANGCLIEVNEQYLVMTGFLKEDLLGQTIKKFNIFSAKQINKNNPVPFLYH
jgi:PAS domain-containing protein